MIIISYVPTVMVPCEKYLTLRSSFPIHKEMNFEFKTDPYILKTITKLMSEIDYHGYFTVSKDGLSGTCVHESNNIGMLFNTRVELTVFKNSTMMVLATPDISRLLRKVSKTDKLTLSDTDNEFVIGSIGKKMSVESRMKKLRKQIVVNHFPDVYQDITGITVDSKNFFTALIDIGDCDIVNIKQKGSGVVIEMNVDRVRQSVTKLGACEGKTNFNSDFSILKLMKLKGVEFVSPLLTLYFRTGYPLKITAQTNLGVIEFYIKSYEPLK